GLLRVGHEPARDGGDRRSVGAKPPLDLCTGMVERSESLEGLVEIGLSDRPIGLALAQVPLLEIDGEVLVAGALQRDARPFILLRNRLAGIEIAVRIDAFVGARASGMAEDESGGKEK